ncbi:nucleolar protein 10-like [Ochlerotatus camptorhynchus]|uniref:nucleolar protein 10-like n=1 Tax=Ochlerotatus camptorhynchus TaxID=644619 RepID=UPI0031D9632C
MVERFGMQEDTGRPSSSLGFIIESLATNIHEVTYNPDNGLDVYNLSLKFERCFDSEVVKFKILSEDYSKVVFLQVDRFVEFHAAHGRHYSIPRFGKDLDYPKPSCDLFLLGASSEIYRLNTERGTVKASTLLSDDRFRNMSDDYVVDKTAFEYRLLNPVLTRFDKSRSQKLKAGEEFEECGSTDEDLFSEKDESSDDDQGWTKQVKKEFRKITWDQNRELRMEVDQKEEQDDDDDDEGPSIAVHEKTDFNISHTSRKISKAGLGKRLAAGKPMETIGGLENRQMTFSTERKKNSGYDKKRQAELRKHREERKKVIRPTTNFKRMSKK